MRVLSYPFRFNPGQPDQFATVDQDSNDYKAQQVTAFMKTHSGERPIYQDFGVDDPTFGGADGSRSFEDTSFASEFATFYDDIILTKINVIASRGALEQIQIEFE